MCEGLVRWRGLLSEKHVIVRSVGRREAGGLWGDAQGCTTVGGVTRAKVESVLFIATGGQR